VLVHPEDLRILESIEDARDVAVAKVSEATIASEGTIPHAVIVAGSKPLEPEAAPRRRQPQARHTVSTRRPAAAPRARTDGRPGLRTAARKR
jgi:hypothetical protein